MNLLQLIHLQKMTETNHMMFMILWFIIIGYAYLIIFFYDDYSSLLTIIL